MKRKANIFIAIMLVFSAFAFSACGKSGDSDSGGTIQTIDRTKEQIYVSVYDGGTGTQWIKEEAEKFNASLDKYQVYIIEGKSSASNIIDEVSAGSNIASAYFSVDTAFQELI